MQVSRALPAKRDERHWPRLLAETQRVNWTVIIIINPFVRLRSFFQQFPFTLTAFNSQPSPFLYINSENCLKMERQQMEPQTRTSRTSRDLRHCRCLSAMFTLVELKSAPTLDMSHFKKMHNITVHGIWPYTKDACVAC